MIDIPPEVIDDLKLTVENAYRVEFEAVVSEAEQVEFTIPGDKIHMYKIFWIQRIYRSTISFSINREPCSVPYEYSIVLPKLDSITTMSCTA